jgi:hypothetical protein
MADFTVDENGVAYDNRQGPSNYRPNAKTVKVEPKPDPDSEFKGSSWWIALVFVLLVILLVGAVVAGNCIRSLENCAGPDCVALPTIFMIALVALSGMFIVSPTLAQDLRGLRYLTAALLFLFLLDFGLAGTLNAWYEGRHYLVATINKATRQVIRTTEPSNSTFFSLVYLLSPLPFFIPDVIRLSRRLRFKRVS